LHYSKNMVAGGAIASPRFAGLSPHVTVIIAWFYSVALSGAMVSIVDGNEGSVTRVAGEIGDGVGKHVE